MERAMRYPLTDAFHVTPTHDHAVGALVFPRAVTLRECAPRADRILPGRGLALSSAVRVVDRVHRHAAHRRPHAAPAHAPGLADRFQRVVLVADLADRGTAVDVHLADFPGAQTQLRVVTFPRQELNRGARRPRELRALAGQHFHAVYGRADRDVPQRQRVPDLDRRFHSRMELHARRYTLRRDDV